jgi:hypothetical protein
LYNSKKWTGWDLNPRPQQAHKKFDVYMVSNTPL